MDVIHSVHLDANESVMFARDLEVIKKKTYDTRFPELKATQLIPISTDAGPAAESITFRSYTEIGLAKIISAYADDLPRADIKGTEHTYPIRSLGSSYGFSIQEIRASQMMGKNLPQRKANAARMMIEQKINKIGWTGDTEGGLTGLINNTNVTRVAAPGDGASSATTFVSKTPAQILRDLNALVNGIVELTKGVEVPDTLLLPLAQFNYLSVTPYSTYSDKTIMAYFKETNLYIKDVISVLELKDAGVGVSPLAAGEDIAIAYKRDIDKLSFELPIPFEQMAPQERNLEQIVNCHARSGGVIIYYPLSVAILEGI
jgi:hypothetical protein